MGSKRVRTSCCVGRSDKNGAAWCATTESFIPRRGATSAPEKGDDNAADGIALRIGKLALRCRRPSVRGTMSIRKSKSSERETALAISERWIVRRLFSSATINARHVRSAMKISQAREKRIGASAEIILTSSSFFMTFLIRASGNALPFPLGVDPRLKKSIAFPSESKPFSTRSI